MKILSTLLVLLLIFSGCTEEDNDVLTREQEGTFINSLQLESLQRMEQSEEISPLCSKVQEESGAFTVDALEIGKDGLINTILGPATAATEAPNNKRLQLYGALKPLSNPTTEQANYINSWYEVEFARSNLGTLGEADSEFYAQLVFFNSNTVIINVYKPSETNKTAALVSTSEFSRLEERKIAFYSRLLSQSCSK